MDLNSKLVEKIRFADDAITDVQSTSTARNSANIV